MNPSKYKSVSMKIKSWHLATELTKVILPEAHLSRSQIVEIALTRWANEIKHDGSNIPDITKEQLNEVKPKGNDLPVVGTAVTHDQVLARNEAIIYHRCISDNKLTLQQLGTMYNITRERVRQIQDRHEVSIKTLKQNQEEKHASNN